MNFQNIKHRLILCTALFVTGGALLFGCAGDTTQNGDTAVTEEGEENGDSGKEDSKASDSSEADAGDQKTDTDATDNGNTSGSPLLDKASAVPAVKKEETVNAKADAAGNITSVKVRTLLSVPEQGDVLSDRTTLSDIKNKSGDEEFSLEADGTLLFENHGEDITYEGVAKDTLPVAVHLRYELDGAEISPEELAGKSGRLTLTFTYENRSAVETTVSDTTLSVPCPYTVISAAILPEEHFKNIEVTHGKLLRSGDTQIAMGMALPGLYDALSLSDHEDLSDTELPEDVTITADVTDFTLDYTATIVTNGLFGELKDEDLNDLTDLSEKLTELGDGSTKITDALTSLKNGGSSFASALSQYTAGVDQLYQGLNALNQSLAAMGIDPALMPEMAALQGSVQQLTEGAKALSQNGSKLRSGFQSMQSGISELQKAYTEFDEDGLQKLSAKGGSELRDLLTKIKALRNADRDQTCFAGALKETECETHYIIETAEIK